MIFSFHRGSIALDFVGTVGRRTSEDPEERLADAADFGDWLVQAKLLEVASPSITELEEARRLREAICDAASELVSGRRPDTRSLKVINLGAEGLRLGSPRLDRDGHVHWVSDAPVRTALGRVAADAIERFAQDPDRLTFCELEGCGALLLSRSRSDRRRWCSMETCGNRAKVAAHRTRERAATRRRSRD
jgi:predicted RNA-binding Zn ribbon-like protein